MATRSTHLAAGDRQFLELVTQAVFANPFSDERTEADLRISGVPKDASPVDRLYATHAKVSSFLADLAGQGKADVSLYAGHDRQVMANAHLFDIFHQFLDRLDELIQSQITQGDESCRVPFANDALRLLIARGFPRPDALRYFAAFYQLRRAYFFIHCALAGRSRSMIDLRRSLWDNVFTRDTRLYDRHLWNRMEDFSTLLLGETGTGKGAAAKAIGQSGFIPFDEKRECFAESFTRSFIAINLSQFPETLIESELFGHRKGAFTGAAEAHEGVFSLCSQHGAIFLDEIGDVSIPVQIKLLRVLEERLFSPVGSHEKRRFHGRVIAASNKPLDDLRKRRLFRDDFFYRLCSDIIVVPPLRQRLHEDPGEMEDMLGIAIQRIIGEPSPELVDLVRSVIERDLGKDYSWPGNVRELEQCVRRILMTRSYKGDIGSVSSDLLSVIVDGLTKGSYQAQDLLIDYCRLLHDRHGTYEEVSRRANLDRRTVRKYVVQSRKDDATSGEH